MKSIFLLLITPALIQVSFAQGVSKSSQTSAEKPALRFIAFGDWGRDGEYKQKDVALQLGKTAKEMKVSFFVSLGDNFYPSGVRSVQDHSWLASYEDIYTAHSLQNDWYVVLGNHDYKGSVQAEIDYTNIDRRWNMPARYYSKKVLINNDTSQQVLLVFLDTTPLVNQYYSSEEHADVHTQDTAAQRKWLEKVLSDSSPNIRWKFVFGHHPLYTGGKRMNLMDTKELNRRLKPIFDKYNVTAYVCGHEHSLQYMKPAGKTSYFISGSGSEVTETILYPEIGEFAKSENGFLVFALTSDEVSFQFINYKGEILYSSAIRRE